MDTNSIILELLSRIKVLENKVEVLEKNLLRNRRRSLINPKNLRSLSKK